MSSHVSFPKLIFIGLCSLVAVLSSAPHAVRAQGVSDPRIVWEVKNRFRLFREEKDFQLHVDALRNRSVLQAEQTMAADSDGRGWARNIVGRLCIDGAGRIAEPCKRDGTDESYLAATDYKVEIRILGADDASCSWLLDKGAEAKAGFLPCSEEVILRVDAGRSTLVAVDVRREDGPVTRVSTEINVRDVLIAGMGDSIASGEGNPDRPVALSDEGFCFRQFVGTSASQYYRPGRAGFKGDKSCETTRPDPGNIDAWNTLSARWQNAACHRSLYSYQLRTALALAVENPHIAVTYVPLACTGSTIDAGILGPRRARELDCGGVKCPTNVPSQISQLSNVLAQARKRDKSRAIDLVLLTIGANDIDFSGIVADVIIEENFSRSLFKRSGVMGTLENSGLLLQQKLPGDFRRMRAALKPLVGDMSHVLYTSYANPVLADAGSTCEGGRNGFDVHPAFSANPARMNAASQFVEQAFLPRIAALATCTAGAVCNAGEAMTFVDAHQKAFSAGHAMCARAPADPIFDNECFSPTGESFEPSLAEAATAPLLCSHRAGEFRAYASRARWIRTANDSYFAAMTYPEGVSQGMQPSDIHDATWGILSAVYGGAVHPTAEGHAAMADAAVVEARRVLGIGQIDPPVTAQPLPPLQPPLQ